MRLDTVSKKDLELLIRDKYGGTAPADLKDDQRRLAAGEPLAYVIGWIPFLGLRIYLDSHPLIPRPETEWWTERLIEQLKERFGEREFTLLDLCAGSGAIGLAVLKHLPNAQVSFGELVSAHAKLIEKNITENGLDASRALVRTGDLFTPFPSERFDVIATNPPYIPDTRTLPESVSGYEPHDALFAGHYGLDIIKPILEKASLHVNANGELWMECDISNSEEAKRLAKACGARGVDVGLDQYDRPRFIVARY